MRAGPGTSLRMVALVIGAVFVLTGVAALVGDPAGAESSRWTAIYVRTLQLLRQTFGDPGAGIAMIVIGLLLGGFLYRAAGRKG